MWGSKDCFDYLKFFTLSYTLYTLFTLYLVHLVHLGQEILHLLHISNCWHSVGTAVEQSSEAQCSERLDLLCIMDIMYYVLWTLWTLDSLQSTHWCRQQFRRVIESQCRRSSNLHSAVKGIVPQLFCLSLKGPCAYRQKNLLDLKTTQNWQLLFYSHMVG